MTDIVLQDGKMHFETLKIKNYNNVMDCWHRKWEVNGSEDVKKWKMAIQQRWK